MRGRVEDIVLKNSGHTVLRKLEHTYDAVDNITEIVETRGSAVTKTFGYDDIDQLISEDWSTGYTADYEYDANGNRTKRTVGATVEDYFYDDGDKLTEIKIGGSVTKSYDYDMSGRRTEMTDGGGTTYYGYDLGDRLTSITRSGLTTNSFGYNGFDTRVSKTDSTGTTSYKRAGAGVTSSLLKSTISSTTTDYTPGISSRVSSTSTFMHSGLKNSDEQSGSGGTIAASLQYDAFGKQVSSSGTWVGAFKYGGAYGYQTDPDHGLKLLGHRYYEADTGRFLTRDPIKDGRNWYGYCENGPVTGTDPMGLRKHVIIYGDNSAVAIGSFPYAGGNAFVHWFMGDEVSIIEPVSMLDFIYSCWDADSLQLSMHGVPGGGGALLGEDVGVVGPEVVLLMARMRADAGLPPMDVVNLDVCYVLLKPDHRAAWSELSYEVHGWTGMCPLWGRDSITRDRPRPFQPVEGRPILLPTVGTRRNRGSSSDIWP